MGDVILTMKGIDKSFPGVHALDHVDLEIRKGEVLALMGENGAGKSTLMKVLTGIYKKDSGTITYEGKEVECEILFTFDSDETKKSYIVYTDNTLDEEGSTKVYASVYDPTGQNPALMPIETEKEWLVIENILSSVQQKIEQSSEE